MTGRHQVHAGSRAPGHALRADRSARGLRRHARVARRCSGARAMPGVKVVRDGDFAGVVAPNERLARTRRGGRASRVARAIRSARHRTTIYEHLKSGGALRRARAERRRSRQATSQRRHGAARTFDATYRIPYIAHVPLEPRAAVAEWSGGKVTVWTGTQRPFGVRAELASAFRIPEDRVRVIVPDTGSAYGGKHTGEHAIEAARLAKAAGKPVKVVWTRDEEFSWGYFRPAGVIEIKAGGRRRRPARRRGSSTTGTPGGFGIRTPYDSRQPADRVPSVVSPLRQGSYRGLAATANHYAREMHMDAIARALGVDAVEFRLRHLERRAHACRADAAARSAFGWPKPSAGTAAAPRHRVRHREGQLRRRPPPRCRRRRERLHGRAARRRVRVRRGRQSGRPAQPGRRRRRAGARRRAVRGDRVRRRRDPERHDGARIACRDSRTCRAIEMVLLDRKDLPSAGAGETPIVCVAPAIGSAVRGLGRVLNSCQCGSRDRRRPETAARVSSRRQPPSPCHRVHGACGALAASAPRRHDDTTTTTLRRQPATSARGAFRSCPLKYQRLSPLPATSAYGRRCRSEGRADHK